MEQLPDINNIFALAAFLATQFIGVIGLYFKIKSDRKSTGEKRDSEFSLVKEMVSILASRLDNLETEHNRTRDFSEKLMDLLADIRADVAYLRGREEKPRDKIKE